MTIDVGLPSIRTTFIDNADMSSMAEVLHCLRRPQEVLSRLLHLMPDRFSVAEDGNIVTAQSGRDKVDITVLEGDERTAFAFSGDEALARMISAHVRSTANAHNDRPLTLLPEINTQGEDHGALIDVFKSLLPAIERELSPYLTSDAQPAKITITFADGHYMVDRFLDSEVLGCFFVQTENDREDAVLSDCGFEVILNMQVIADELMDADSEKYLVSMVSTLPHEIIHALNFANASRGLTPLETYDCGLLNTVRDHYMQTTFGSAEKEEQFTELTGLLIAKKLCTPNIIRQMAQVSASHEPEVRALCRSSQRECE